jgi:hypothetical protein
MFMDSAPTAAFGPRPGTRVREDGANTGPGMVAPILIDCRWLNLVSHGRDIGPALRPSGGRTTFTLAPLRGAPPGQQVRRPVCAWADGVVPDQQLIITYRRSDAWDRGLPATGGARGWLAAHVRGSGQHESSVLVGAVNAAPGVDMYIERGSVRLNVLSEDPSGVNVLVARENRSATGRVPAVVSWGPNRLDIFGIGIDRGLYHKAWQGHWHPSDRDWLPLGSPPGGRFTPPGVASWGPNRLDVFGLGAGNVMYHRAWMEQYWQEEWEGLGGVFITPPTVTSWGPGRLDVYGLGADGGIWSKTWDESAGGWDPKEEGWRPLGGRFISRPVAVSRGPGRLDVFGVGTDNGAYHKAWQGQWRATDAAGRGIFQGDWNPKDGWEPLGGRCTSPLAVASWGPDRLDIFGIGTDNAMYHRAWEGPAGRWYREDGWQLLGGAFSSPPAVVSWGPGRLDIFGLGLDSGMYHKSWDGGWYPSERDWEPLGGRFTSPPAVASWRRGRLDVFGLGMDNSMYHRAWEGHWHPRTEWEPLGGGFS